MAPLLAYGAHVLIDTHTHVVSTDTVSYPQQSFVLPNGSWWDGVDCSVEHLAREVDESGVDGVVLVQAGGTYGEDNSYLAAAVGHDAERFVGSCIVDPGGDDAVARLADWAAHAGISGIRLFHIPQPDVPWLASPVGDRMVDAAAKLGLSIAICCQADDLPDLAVQIARRPDVNFALDHCGFADFTRGAPFAAASALWDLAAHKNLAVKVTPTLVRINDAVPEQLVEAVVGRFGASHVLWGSDWPQHREVGESGRPLTYGEQVALIQSWFGGLPAADRAAIGGGNALRLWPGAWPHLRTAHEPTEKEA